MIANAGPWRAALVEDFLTNGHRIVLARTDAETGTLAYLTQDRGAALLERRPAEDLPPDEAAIVLPDGALDAIRALLAPLADAGEVAALRQALDLERARVDRVLAQLDAVTRTPGTVVALPDGIIYRTRTDADGR